jgi:regulator of sigma E protease
MSALHNLFYFTVALVVLVAFHEFGHYWVARKTGVKVLRFSIGFGPTLWRRRKSPDDTEFALSAIPLGGYVKMVDEREGEVSPADLPYAFNRQPIWKRAAIVAAGPIFNLALAVLLFWVVLMTGQSGLRPIVGEVSADGVAAESGFLPGDEVLSVQQLPAPTWDVVLEALMTAVADGEQTIVIAVKAQNGENVNRIILTTEQDRQDPEAFFKRFGLKPWMPVLAPIIERLTPDDIAQRAGLQSGDRLLSADGTAINDWGQWVDYVKSKPAIPIHLLVDRGGAQLELTLVPRMETQADGRTVGKIGAGVKPLPPEVLQQLTVEYRLGPWDALSEAVHKTTGYAHATLTVFGKMLVGQASIKNLGGPISIAEYAGQSAELGWVKFLEFLAHISISLGVLNLLPVPVLDGGHLMMYAIEALKGNALSARSQQYLQQIGLALLLTLMMFALYVDWNRWLQ